VASQGPFYPTTATSVAGAAPETAEAWLTPANVVSDNGTESTIVAATYDSPDVSQRLRTTGHGFTIPAGSTINGIVVEIDRRSIIAGSGADYRVQLHDNGTLLGNNRADTVTVWPTTSGVKTYGTSTDIASWGAITVADVNSATFGVALAASAKIANADIGVDFIRITVYYTAPASEPHSGSATITGGGAVTPAGRKGAAPSVTLTGGGAVTPATLKGARAAAVVTGGGSVTYSYDVFQPEQHSGSATITGGGAVTSVGRRGALSGVVVSGGGTVSYAVGTARAGASAVTGGGTVSGVVARGARGSAVVTGSGAVVFSARKGALTGLVVTGGGSVVEAHQTSREGAVVVTGSGVVLYGYVAGSVEAHQGAAHLTGGGSVSASGRKGASGSASLTGGGAVTVLASTDRRSALVITGGGRVSLLWTGAHGGSAVITGGGRVTASTSTPVIVAMTDQGVILDLTPLQIATWFYTERGLTSDIGILTVQAADAVRLRDAKRARRLSRAAALLSEMFEHPVVDDGEVNEQLVDIIVPRSVQPD
jgi:hypothetical protein